MSVISLGPTQDIIPNEQQKLIDNQKMEVEDEEKQKHHFVDEVRINDKKVLQIGLEHQFYEPEKPKRKSRWGEKQDKKKVHTDVIFNPYLSIGGPLSLKMLQNGQNTESAIAERLGKTSKRSKWGEEYQKTFHPPPFHFIPSHLSLDEIEYLMRLYRLDEVTKKLLVGDCALRDPDVRSPSPPPIYDKGGQRVNTRNRRWQEYIQREKHDIIEELKTMKPESFKTPQDYKAPKKSRKIYIPGDDPESNYLAQVIGPRGSTQKSLEQRTQCQIAIRGRGTNAFIKQGALDDDRIYIQVSADTDEILEAGVATIERVLRGEPDIMDDKSKNKQLQLMAVTGVLRDDYCENCYEKGHRIWACPAKIKQKNDIICQSCGDKSHVTIDCPFKDQFNSRESLKRQQMNRYQFQVSEANQKEFDFLRFLSEVEGENASKLLELVQNAPQHKNVLPLDQRMAFITETVPGQNLQITDGGKGSSFSQTAQYNKGNIGRLDQYGGSNLQMAKFLSANLTADQKIKSFQNRGQDLERLFARDTYVETVQAPRVVQQPQHMQGYINTLDNQIQITEIMPEGYSAPQNNPLNQNQIQQLIMQQNAKFDKQNKPNTLRTQSKFNIIVKK